MVKLYKRVSGKLHYHEAWYYERVITEHWGIVGELGQSKKHKVSSQITEEAALALVLQSASDDGFKPMPLDKHAVLFIEYAIEGFGTREDLNKQHRLQERMDEVLGWSGLGHCDGCSRSSGTMEICCVVVDFETAKRLIESDLRNTEFANYSRIYREDSIL